MPVANKITCSRVVPCDNGYCLDEKLEKYITIDNNRLFSFSIRWQLARDVMENRRTIYTIIAPTAIEKAITVYII